VKLLYSKIPGLPDQQLAALKALDLGEKHRAAH